MQEIVRVHIMRDVFQYDLIENQLPSIRRLSMSNSELGSSLVIECRE